MFRRWGFRGLLCSVSVLVLALTCSFSDVAARAQQPVAYYVLSTNQIFRVPKPSPNVAGPIYRVHMDFLIAAPDGGIALVCRRSAMPGTHHWQQVWHISADGAQMTEVELPLDGARILAAAAVPSGVFLGTYRVLFKIKESSAEPFDSFVYPPPGTQMRLPPYRLPLALADMAADGAGNLWLMHYSQGTMFPSNEWLWEWGIYATGVDAYPRLRWWRAPISAVGGAVGKAGLWIYGMPEEGEADLLYADESSVKAARRGYAPSPSVVPEGVKVPVLANACLAPDSQGRLWLAGDTLNALKAYLFDGNSFLEVSPPADLLKHCSFTQLIVDAAGKLYAPRTEWACWSSTGSSGVNIQLTSTCPGWKTLT